MERVNPIVPGYIVSIYCLLSERSCARLVEEAEASGFRPASALPSPVGAPRALLPHRRGQVVRVLDSLASDLGGQVRRIAPDALDDGARFAGVAPRLLFERFVPGQSVPIHAGRDEDTAARLRPRWSLIVFLNDDYRGGAIRFRKLRVRPAVGGAVLFRRELEHGLGKVAGGVRYALRADVLYRDPVRIRVAAPAAAMVSGRFR